MDWEDIKVLGELAKRKKVRAAAKGLGVHHSTVSRRIDALEQAAETQLFTQTPEGYVLTEAGEHLARTAQVMEGEIIRAQRLISGGDKELAGRIIVTMAEPVALHAFAHRLPEFIARYPKLEVEITSSTSMVDLARRKADVAVRMSNNPPEDLFGKRLFPYYSTVYASPKYLAEHPLDADPESGRWIGWDGSFDRHPQWAAETPFKEVPAWGNFPNLDMQVALATAGVGLAMIPCFLGDRAPGLVRVTDDPPVPGLDIWILTHSDLRRTAKIRAFMAFAEQVIRDNKAWFLGYGTG